MSLYQILLHILAAIGAATVVLLLAGAVETIRTERKARKRRSGL